MLRRIALVTVGALAAATVIVAAQGRGQQQMPQTPGGQQQAQQQRQQTQQQQLQMAQMQQMTQRMDQVATHLMLQDRTLAEDRDMQRDMDRLRERLNTVTGGLQDMATTMEQMHERIPARTAATEGR
jgi:hypothetical protein